MGFALSMSNFLSISLVYLVRHMNVPSFAFFDLKSKKELELTHPGQFPTGEGSL
jgi:hypothetical protein